MTQQEMVFFREFYKILSTANFNELLVKYADIEYNKALETIRHKKDMYDYGYANGKMDAWRHIIGLKETVTKIMNNIG